MKKRVLLLAVSCKTGGLCPGGLDLDDPNQWIRIVSNDGNSGAVQGFEIDFAKPLDIVEFEGVSMPQGRQQENWVILNGSCRKLGHGEVVGNEIVIKSLENSIQNTMKITDSDKVLLSWAFKNYPYHGFWGNYRPFLNEIEFRNGTEPSESILLVSNVKIYGLATSSGDMKAKIDFESSFSQFPIKWISLTDQDYYDKIENGNAELLVKRAIIVVSIPKDCDWTYPNTGEKRAYKFVSKVFPL